MHQRVTSITSYNFQVSNFPSCLCAGLSMPPKKTPAYFIDVPNLTKNTKNLWLIWGPELDTEWYGTPHGAHGVASGIPESNPHIRCIHWSNPTNPHSWWSFCYIYSFFEKKTPQCLLVIPIQIPISSIIKSY